MTWTLIVSLAFAVTGFQTREECLRAGKDVSTYTWVCLQTPKGGAVVGSGR